MSAPNLRLLLPEPLKQLLAATRIGLPFGIPALDAALLSGIPRGQITVLDAPLGTGGTALLLALAETTLRADEGVAIVDAERSLAPQTASHLAALGPFWVIRPKATESAWWCADVLLRTGAFGLVIVDRAPAPARKVAVRLQRLARDKSCALVVREAARRSGGQATSDSGRIATACPPVRPSALVLSVQPLARASGFIPALSGWGGAWPAPRALRVIIERGGAPRAAEVVIGFPLPDRLRPHWAVRDRRGGRRTGGPAVRRAERARTDRPTA